MLWNLRSAMQQVILDIRAYIEAVEINFLKRFQILGVHRSRKTTAHGRELTTEKLSTTSQRELWTIVMDSDLRPVISEGEIMLHVAFQ